MKTFLLILLFTLAVAPAASAAPLNELLRLKTPEKADPNDRIIEQLAENRVEKLTRLKWADVEALPADLARKVVLARLGASPDQAYEDCKTALREKSRYAKLAVTAAALRHQTIGRKIGKLVDGYASVDKAIVLTPDERTIFKALTTAGELPAGKDSRARPLILQRNAALSELREHALRDATVNSLIRETIALVSNLEAAAAFDGVVPVVQVKDLAVRSNTENGDAALALAVHPYLNAPVEDLRLLFQQGESRKGK